MIEKKNIKIAVASGKGGTGKTLISTNLYYSLLQTGIDVTLIDCDAEEPNAVSFFDTDLEKSIEVTQKVPVIDIQSCTFCGACKDYCNYNAIFLLPAYKIIKVIEDLCHGCGACTVACQSEAITEKDVSLGSVIRYQTNGRGRIFESRMNVGVFSPVLVIKKAIKEAGDEGIVIMDSPPGTSCPFIQTVSKADYVVLVTEPTPFGLSDLKQSVETLKTMDKMYGVIVNRAGLGDHGVYDYLLEEGIPLLMEIPFDKKIASLYSKGEIVVKTNSRLQEEFIDLYQSIIRINGNSNHQR